MNPYQIREAEVLARQLEAVKQGRRYKSYAAETCVSYRYFFDSSRSVVRPEGQGEGIDFTFVALADQHPPVTLKVFLSNRALAVWRELHSRELDAREQYAAAKMRLFRAFDEEERLRLEQPSLLVDESNVEELLQPLNLA
jgi:hypothetical protein